ncbi:MAG: hypothetical protein LBS60_08990 [Deltaproteobacteria bacterium]|jgi:hypothetical protein|nr:hypothetical protein [Deltaproteobacteria bacterium]
MKYSTANLVKDLVYMDLPQSSEVKITLDSIMRSYQMTESELLEVINKPEVVAAYKTEIARAKELGHRAAYVFRVEEMLIRLVETLYSRLHDPDTPLAEFVKAFVALARSVGMDALPGAEKAVGSQVNVQINIPQLNNPKLRHLEVTSNDV